MSGASKEMAEKKKKVNIYKLLHRPFVSIISIFEIKHLHVFNIDSNLVNFDENKLASQISVIHKFYASRKQQLHKNKYSCVKGKGRGSRFGSCTLAGLLSCVPHRDEAARRLTSVRNLIHLFETEGSNLCGVVALPRYPT